jgi:hypothetical protein
MLLELSEYLELLKQTGVRDKGNGTYPRAFESLSRNSMIINVPRTRYTDFKIKDFEEENWMKYPVNYFSLL